MILPLVTPVALPFDNVTITAVQIASIVLDPDTGIVQVIAAPLEAPGPGHAKRMQFNLTAPQLATLQAAIKAAVAAAPGVPALQ